MNTRRSLGPVSAPSPSNTRQSSTARLASSHRSSQPPRYGRGCRACSRGDPGRSPPGWTSKLFGADPRVSTARRRQRPMSRAVPATRMTKMSWGPDRRRSLSAHASREPKQSTATTGDCFERRARRSKVLAAGCMAVPIQKRAFIRRESATTSRIEHAKTLACASSACFWTPIHREAPATRLGCLCLYIPPATYLGCLDSPPPSPRKPRQLASLKPCYLRSPRRPFWALRPLQFLLQPTSSASAVCQRSSCNPSRLPLLTHPLLPRRFSLIKPHLFPRRLSLSHLCLWAPPPPTPPTPCSCALPRLSPYANLRSPLIVLGSPSAPSAPSTTSAHYI